MGAPDLEWYLASQGIVETEMEENPARARGANSIKMRRGVRMGRKGSEEEDEFDDDFDDEY